MRFLPLILCALLCSCETSFYSARTGRKLFSTHADLEQVVIRITIPGEGTYLLTAARVNHSAPMAMALHGASNIVGAVALGVAPFAGGPAAVRIAAPLGSGAGLFKAAPAASTPAPKATPKP